MESDDRTFYAGLTIIFLFVFKGECSFQMPFFISFFLGIRGLANYPLESMMNGGVLWFPDLTVADPYYVLPVFTAVTMLITMEVRFFSSSVVR